MMLMSDDGKPQIIGWAHTPFGRLEHPDVESLIANVCGMALDDAGLEPSDIDAVSVGVYNNGFSRQGFEGALVGAAIPDLAHVPAARAENACATGSAALFSALDQIEAGRAQVVLVVGAEKMTGAPAHQLNEILLSACHRPTQASLGSFAGVFAEVAELYADRYVEPHDAMAAIAAKNHHNAISNPWAHMRRDLGFDFCATESERNPRVAGRLLRTDCSTFRVPARLRSRLLTIRTCPTCPVSDSLTPTPPSSSGVQSRHRPVLGQRKQAMSTPDLACREFMAYMPGSPARRSPRLQTLVVHQRPRRGGAVLARRYENLLPSQRGAAMRSIGRRRTPIMLVFARMDSCGSGPTSLSGVEQWTSRPRGSLLSALASVPGFGMEDAKIGKSEFSQLGRSAWQEATVATSHIKVASITRARKRR
jgi:Thiolase, N-terminal domain